MARTPPSPPFNLTNSPWARDDYHLVGAYLRRVEVGRSKRGTYGLNGVMALAIDAEERLAKMGLPVDQRVGTLLVSRKHGHRHNWYPTPVPATVVVLDRDKIGWRLVHAEFVTRQPGANGINELRISAVQAAGMPRSSLRELAVTGEPSCSPYVNAVLAALRDGTEGALDGVERCYATSMIKKVSSIAAAA